MNRGNVVLKGVMHSDCLGVNGRSFWLKHQPFVVRDYHRGGNLAEGKKFSLGVKVTKKTMYFWNHGMTCIKPSMDLHATSGVNGKLSLSWNEMRERKRKITHNSSVKLKATK